MIAADMQVIRGGAGRLLLEPGVASQHFQLPTLLVRVPCRAKVGVAHVHPIL